MQKVKSTSAKSPINPHIFRAYDIRGIAETTPTQNQTPGHSPDLTPETVYLIGRGTGTHLKRKYNTRNMAVGRDVRNTGPTLQEAFIKGILECGIDVTDLGLSPSPMVYWASCTDKLDFDSATNITASHNPKEYNGLKTVSKNAHAICGDELQEVLKLIQNNDFITPEELTSRNETSGKLTQQDIWPLYRDELLTKAKLSKPLKVVIDAGNGVAGPFAPELLTALGCEVIPLYCEPDGNFPNHESNPEELKNMQDLITAVKEHRADLGIGFDGDSDRIGVVDEKGHMYSSDFMLLLLAEDLLKRLPGSQIVFDVKVSQAIINKIEALGGIPVMSKTGHSFIEAKMKEIGAPLAGEVSGHLFFGENYYGFDDALLAAAKVLEILSKSDKTMSQQFTDLPETFTTPEVKARTPDDKKFQIVQSLVEHFTAHYDCITIDGARVKFDTRSWAAVRASNTSPNLTLRFEADSPEKLQEIQDIMVTELKKHPEVDISWYES